MSHPVIVQLWNEFERGWGVRPDGCSLHKTESDRVKFIEEYWSRQPEEVPDEYSAPGEFYLIDLEDDVLYGQINENNPYGLWIWQCDMTKFKLNRK